MPGGGPAAAETRQRGERQAHADRLGGHEHHPRGPQTVDFHGFLGWRGKSSKSHAKIVDELMVFFLGDWRIFYEYCEYFW